MREMKDSGVEWLGEIPSDWEIERAKNSFRQKSERGNEKSLVLLSPTQNYGVIPQEMYEELSGLRAVKLNTETDLNSLKTVHKGAFVISLRSFQGGFEYSEYEGVVSPAYQVFYPVVAVSDYYYKYLFKSQAFIDKMNSFTLSLRDGKNIAFADFARTYIPIPPLYEQEKIAEALNQKCAQIDALITNVQIQIEKLKAYKQSMITEVVTKGLDPNVPMKDSGVEWIGEIAETWTLNRIKYVSTCNDDVLKESSNPNMEIEYVEIGSVSLANGIERTEKMLFKEAPSRARRIARHGDIIISTVRTYLKAIALIEVDEYIVSTGFCVIRSKSNINSRYLKYFCSSEIFTEWVSACSTGISYPAINANTLINFHILCPEMRLQQQIAQYLDKKCGQIERLIAIKQSKIEKLEQYKKSLIYEYVTGKKEVL